MKKVLLVGASILMLGACGADGEQAVVPNVVGERLDVAQAHVEDAGLKSDAIGGGTFGIIDESNWTVCKTEPAAGVSGANTVRLIVDRSCPGTEPVASSDTTSSTEPTSTTTAAPSTTSTTTATAAPTSAAKIRVPNVVGKDLQTAQDTMQAAGLYNLTSHDSTGLGRMQVLDRNWLVTEQSPRAGTNVDEYQLIDLGTRKFTD